MGIDHIYEKSKQLNSRLRLFWPLRFKLNLNSAPSKLYSTYMALWHSNLGKYYTF